jgi:predicted transcriptional regulator of viral defense system
MFAKYMKSEKKDMESLIKYAKLLGSGAVFKRLGFLLERYAKDEKNAIDTCKLSLTTGNVKLDPKLSADKLITKWRLWVPSNWIKEN